MLQLQKNKRIKIYIHEVLKIVPWHTVFAATVIMQYLA